jgi:hypothetical protein
METTLQANKGRYDGLGPLGASLLFHALLIAVLNSTSSFDFTVGNETRFDILWFAAADLASPSTRGVKELASAAAPPRATAGRFPRGSGRSRSVQPKCPG